MSSVAFTLICFDEVSCHIQAHLWGGPCSKALWQHSSQQQAKDQGSQAIPDEKLNPANKHMTKLKNRFSLSQVLK